ncbi:bifunctional metallophosphatase/5'-nucleotidase [Sphingomonas ginkgonis]|uniref:Bifunctional metallophosphatase/5'-nucleotidase n=1 Tax=Sphingomonas ginkgonis TaxID=2315330 RepID=A0A3R9Z7J8_9SPHN|nr:bifunctional metallophosphatase/5'-nucleotidase [Sphingomonas ginkgonis]RST31741.1 bifunctional metallophosphatase/5'-nucleotidase [Sphingomonas ginkgonis]
MSKRLIPVLLLGLAGCAGPLATTPRQAAGPVEVQILGLNDFHGNLEAPDGTISITGAAGKDTPLHAGGAAQMAAKLQELRKGHPNSITVAAGDLIGASPIASSYFLDEPSVTALGMAGLSLASVGNHEFDRGSGELLRMQKGGCQVFTSRKPCAVEPFKGAAFTYLAANVQRADGSTLFPATAIRRFGRIRVGFIGMTLRDTGILASPAGVAGLHFADEAATANALVPRLKAQGADTIVLLIHQGGKAPKVYEVQSCDQFAGPILGIMDQLDPAIRVVVSGHTHYAYNCTLNRGGADRLLTSAGKYAYLVSDILLSFDPRTRALLSATAQNVPIDAAGPADPAVAALTARYVAAAAPVADRVVGRLPGPALKAEDDGEGTAAALIADSQLAASRKAGAQVAFINGPGVRTSLKPRAGGSVRYGDIFQMQPFGNTLVTRTLTGAQLKAVLEQQFSGSGSAAKVNSLLVPSQGFRFRYDLTRPAGQRITLMELGGRPVDPAARYRVTVNNFLASGGDGFSACAAGTDPADSGVDLDAMEAWLRTNPALPTLGRTK